MDKLRLITAYCTMTMVLLLPGTSKPCRKLHCHQRHRLGRLSYQQQPRQHRRRAPSASPAPVSPGCNRPPPSFQSFHNFVGPWRTWVPADLDPHLNPTTIVPLSLPLQLSICTIHDFQYTYIVDIPVDSRDNGKCEFPCMVPPGSSSGFSCVRPVATHRLRCHSQTQSVRKKRKE